MIKMHIRKFLKAESGIAAIEMAFVLPAMLLLYCGMMDVTGLVSTNRKITASASTTADLVGQQKTSILKAVIDDDYNATAMIFSPNTLDNVRVEVFGYRTVSGTVTKIWHTSNLKGPSCGVDPDISGMPSLMTSGNDLIVARSCQNYTPYVVTFLGTSMLGSASFLVKQSISVRPRSSLDLTCYDTTVGGTKCT
jgi:Flp pilus assembly pilin Flp